jgi:hypothetical protein
MTTEQQASPADTTQEHQASRTLVKSPPELWAECSDAGSLARHLGEFGEIRITRLEPDTDVAWEGERASGTVRIESSAWGTRVTLTAQTKAEPPAAANVEAAADPPDEVPDGLVTPSHSVEEEDDETVEETLEEPDPALAAGPGRIRLGWTGLRARTRTLFGRKQGSVDPPHAEAESAASTEPHSDRAPAEPEAVVVRDEPNESASLPSEPEAVASAFEAASEQPHPEADPSLDPDSILIAALDSLGQAHHRPFSRA